MGSFLGSFKVLLQGLKVTWFKNRFHVVVRARPRNLNVFQRVR